MKAKIKATGKIMQIAEYAKIILDVCNSYRDLLEFKPEEIELIPDTKEDNFPTIDWNQVRVQASIGAMQVLLRKYTYDPYKDIAAHAVRYGDAIVKELKKQ